MTDDFTPKQDDRADALARWLSHAGRQFDPRFPREIKGEWEAQNGPSRIRALRLSALTGCVTGGLMAPLLWRMMPDAHAAIRFWWLGAALPAAAASYALLWARLELAVQEWQVVACAIGVALCFTAMVASGGGGQAGLYSAGIMLLIMLDTVAGRLRFRPAAVLVGGLVAVFAGGILAMPRFDSAAKLAQIAVLAISAFCALFGNWRFETELRRGFALALRERLARETLARQNLALGELAGRDPLTSLANRRTYDHWLATHWEFAARTCGRVGLVLIDIDYFKAYNDYYGHAAGDACLQVVARCLRDQCRGTTDHVARIGGEEFAVLLPGLTLEVVGDVAERLRAAVAIADVPHLGAGKPRRITLSCGAASFHAASGASQRTLFAAADAALYQAKQTGRNRVCLAEQPAAPLEGGGADGQEHAVAHPSAGS